LIENITREMFRESLNTKFRLRAETSEPIELELVELTESISTPKHEQFALLFRGPQNPFLPQMTYHLEHEKLGEFDLFLVPVGRGQNGFQYEAVFNRFLEAD
jgi:hypothetical protein